MEVYLFEWMKQIRLFGEENHSVVCRGSCPCKAVGFGAPEQETLAAACPGLPSACRATIPFAPQLAQGCAASCRTSGEFPELAAKYSLGKWIFFF